MTERRRAGAGSVTKIKSGHWARITLSDGARRSLGVYPTEVEADEVLHAALVKLAAGEYAPVGGITLRMFGERWLSERELSDDIRDIRNDRSRFENHVATHAIADLPLRAIAPQHIAEWRRSLRGKIAAGPRGGKPISRKTTQEVVRLLKSILAAAASPEEGLIAASPAAGLTVKREQRTHEPWDYLRPDEIARWKAAEEIPEADKLIVLFARYTGLRLGEQMNLELPDLIVHGDHPEVVVRFGSKGKPPKNGKIRRVPLFGEGLAVARRWLEVLPTYAPKNPHRLAFPTPTGARRSPGKHLHRGVWDPVTKKQAKVDFFKKYLAAIGVTRPFRWHDLRHTCASSLVSGWLGRRWSLEETKEFMGHVSRTSTERYAHMAEGALRVAAAETHASRPVGGYGAVTTATMISSEVSEIAAVGRQGLEPWTYGLKARAFAEELLRGSAPNNRDITADAVAALKALAVRDGAAGRQAGRQLAMQVLREALTSPAPRAALEVLAGGPHEDDRIVELCSLVLEAERTAAGRRSA